MPEDQRKRIKDKSLDWKVLVVCMTKLTGKIELMVRYNNCYDSQSSQKNQTQSMKERKRIKGNLSKKMKKINLPVL